MTSDYESRLRYKRAQARSRDCADRARYTPTTPKQAAARALRAARGGSTLAKVAVTSALGEANDWPQAMRTTACTAFGLTPDDPGPIFDVQRAVRGF